MRNTTTDGDRELATLVTLERRSAEFQRARLESELAHASDLATRLCVLRSISALDMALMELGAGRLPTVRV